MNYKLNGSIALSLWMAGIAGANAQETSVPNIPPELSAPEALLLKPDALLQTLEAAEDSEVPPLPTVRPAEPATSPKLVGRAVPVSTEMTDWPGTAASRPVRNVSGQAIFVHGESTPTVVCAPLRVCDIELQAGEVVQGSPHVGDSIRWKIAPAISGTGEQRVTHLIVKPTEAGLDTNLIVTTDRHTYHIRLMSSAERYVSGVAFEYPDEQNLAWGNLAKTGTAKSRDNSGALPDMPLVAVNRLNFNYKIKVVNGKPSFKPLRAMDDGYHTYIAMNEDLSQREAPALIGISASGEEQMINYRLKGNIYVIDGTVARLALISGVGKKQERIELTRNPCTTRGWLGMCWDPKE